MSSPGISLRSLAFVGQANCLCEELIGSLAKSWANFLLPIFSSNSRACSSWAPPIYCILLCVEPTTRQAHHAPFRVQASGGKLLAGERVANIITDNINGTNRVREYHTRT